MINGIWNKRMVYIDGVPLDLERSLKVRNHSPDGFCWGYSGSGPSQLALALLLHFGATDEESLSWYQSFKQDVIAKLPQDDFTMNESRVKDWLEAKRLFVKEFGEGENEGY